MTKLALGPDSSSSVSSSQTGRASRLVSADPGHRVPECAPGLVLRSCDCIFFIYSMGCISTKSIRYESD